MTTFNFNYLNNYANHGQNAEQSIRYALTGTIERADNLAHNLGTDCLTYQIKSARASICKGTSIEEYLADDKASEYIYGTKEGVAYVMSREEYIAFVKEFGTVTRESGKNGGAEKIRLKHETSAMLNYLAERVA
jgi:predicted DNA-binding protein